MVVVGAGRVGNVLARGGVRLVRRGEPVEGDGPIVVCTRNDDLDGVIEGVPVRRREELVFVQNGVLDELLHRWDLHRPTIGVLWFAASDRSGVARTGPPSWFGGPHAAAMARHFEDLGLPVGVLAGEAAIASAVRVKLLWNVVFGVLGESTGRPVGAIAPAAVQALVGELAPVLGVPADWEGHLAYAASIPDFRASLREWGWRNGWVRARARAQGMATPIHDGLLASLGRPTPAEQVE